MEHTKKAACIRPFRAAVALFFLTAYLAIVASLVWWLLFEKQKIEDVRPSDREECRKLICPEEHVCTHGPLSDEVQCTSISPANVQTVELVLGIVIGMPAAVCLPCVVQWIVRAFCPSVWQWLSDNVPWNRPVADEQLEANPVMDLETMGAMIGNINAVQQQTGHGAPGVKGVPKDDKSKDVKGRKAKNKNNSRDAQPSPSTAKENLDELFTPMARKQHAKEEALQDAESEIDLLFAPKAHAQGLPKRHEGKSQPPDQAAHKSGAPLQPSETELESAFSALFHRPARSGPAVSEKKRALPPMPVSPPSRPEAKHVNAARDVRSEISEGLSLLFTSMHRMKSAPHGHAPAQSTLQGSYRQASFVVSPADNALSRDGTYYAQDVPQEGYAVDDELGDPPDFWGYALRLAESAKMDGRGDFGESSESGVSVADSFESLEPVEFMELFHCPLGMQPL
eukprot:TRINITY_DN89277_c0_g1_i1.p1 TRINITY_DN89277_c0_g1~~TRINITY_DN89277_c0_g1_i1.p1  ORF type:complete len:453 (-),score=66.81 TRINITY_DN89277_c0_g1_i1:87-1445(-)